VGPVNWLGRIRARVAGTDPLLIDSAVACAFIVGGLVEVALIDAHGESRVLTGMLAVAMFSPLAWRRRAPVATAVATATVPVVAELIGENFLLDNTTAPFVALLLVLYSVGRYVDGARLWPVLAFLFVALAMAIALSNERIAVEEAVWIIFNFGLPVLAGRALRGRVLLQRELREKAEREEAERAERARRALEAERDRIASELQAAVMGGVSAMVVQAEAVPRVLAAGDSGRASESLAAIEQTGREALVEMRRLLGVLRRDGERAALAPQPGLSRLDALAERQRERGLEVDLRVEGSARDIPPGVDLTAYRVVEDALEAALEQRAQHARILVRYRESDLQLEVRDDRDGGAWDRLPGLRDRVGLYGGHLSAGREDGDGFRLRVRLPLEEVVR
jgi:signal transduction histidine kinase